MKHFLSKVKRSCKRFMTGKSGFSLVELIVVIAIMAVMAAVLAPALLGYVERSRAQKDNSALDEVVNSVQLSLADQDVYDEMLLYSAEQYSCYVDSDSPDEANKVDIKTSKYYMYNDNERQLDETVYRLDGVMRGVTITFAPDAASSNKATFDLIKGHVNKYLPSGKKTYGGLTGAAASPKLADIPESELYNNLRATIGDKIAISSQTYRNSEYTIFISMGTTGGQEAAQQDAIKVWGQFSGTNLPEGSSVAGNTATGSNEFKEPVSGGGTSSVPAANDGKIEYGVNDPDLNLSGIIPEGGSYKVDSTKEFFYGGDTFPTLSGSDEFTYGDYQYFYVGYWQVSVLDKTKTEYGPILESINGVAITELSNTFEDCKNLQKIPVIPSTVTSLNYTFSGCTSIIDASNLIIPNGVNGMDFTFNFCTNLQKAPQIPDSVQYMRNAFGFCTSLQEKPNIPNGISESDTLYGCTQFGY